MDVELGTEVLADHGGALQVPARTAPAPRGRPRTRLGLAVLVRLPEGEVPGIALALVGVGVGGRLHVSSFWPGQLAVGREGPDVEVDVTVGGVGVPAVDQPLHQRDHLGDVARGSRLVRGRQAAERVVGPRAGALVLVRPGPPGDAVRLGLREDLVVDVGDVADVGDVEAADGQPAPQHVESQGGADVADVRAAWTVSPQT